MILLIDTSTRTARVGLVEDEKLLDGREWEANSELGRRLLEEIDGLLKRHNFKLKDVERVAVHRGQAGGSFMALRAGIVTGSMLAEAVDAELMAVEGNEVETMIKELCQGKVVEVVEPKYTLPKGLDKS